MNNKKIGWKIYFFILLFLLLFSYADIMYKVATFFDYADIIISLIALLGLFGYSFQRKIYARKLWSTWFIVIIIWDVVHNMFITKLLGLAQNNIQFGLAEYLLGMLIVLPEYIALYLYGYKSTDLWKGEQKSHDL
jgi:hypothetical protein